MRHQLNQRLQEDIKLQDFAINALRKLVGDEDKANLAIKKELEKGPLRVRVLSREELKIEVKKYKNVSLKVIKELQKAGKQVPGYASSLVKEFEAGDNVEGMVKVKNSDHDELDGYEESMFEAQSEMPDDIPDKV